MSKPYTYLIGWSNHHVYYYGVRFARGCSPADLWTTYFTSSKSVKRFRLLYGEPDIRQIRKVFDCPSKARIWEERVLKRIDASSRDDFLNKANGKAIVNSYTHYRSLSDKFKGRTKTEEHKSKMRGKRPHVNQRGVNNNAFKGVIITPFGEFENLHEAAEIESVHFSTIAWRINSNNYKDYMRETI